MTDRIPDACVALPDVETARPIMQGHPYNFGFIPNMTRLVMAHPGIAPFFAALFKRVMFDDGALTRVEREMVAAVAAGAQDCHY